MSAGWFTVHGTTRSFRAFASARRSRVSDWKFGDHAAQPAAAASAGTEPPWSSSFSPANHGDGTPSRGATVSNEPPSLVRQTVPIAGFIRLTAASVRQSNDWTVV